MDEFQIEQSVEDETYYSYTNSTSPSFVERIGDRLETDVTYFSGDDDTEEPDFYVCVLKDDHINVIGSRLEREAANFKVDVLDPMLPDEIPDWLDQHPIQQILKLTTNSDVAMAFALAPRIFTNENSHRDWGGETIFRPAFADSFTSYSELRQNTIGAYLLRNFAYAVDESVFEALKNDALAKDTAARDVVEHELSKTRTAFEERYGE